MVKWISRRSSEPLLGVRIPLGAQNIGYFVQATGTTVLRRDQEIFHQKNIRDHKETLIWYKKSTIKKFHPMLHM